MDVVYVGTLLHYDSVLARTLRKPLWKARTFRSILRWPDRMDLWDAWESLLSSRGEAEPGVLPPAQGEDGGRGQK